MSEPVKIHFRLEQDEDGFPPAGVESVWALPTENPKEYIIDNVPFFVREATIDDNVAAREEDGQLWFERVVRRSENSLIRVVFFDRSVVQAVRDHLAEMGCSVEYMQSFNVLAVNIPPQTKLAAVQSYLEAEMNAGKIDYEEPLLRQ